MRYGEVMRPLDPASIELPEHLKLDPDVARYLLISDRTRRAEIVSAPDTWSSAEKEAYARDDWFTFSRLRGYSQAEIEDFQIMLDLCHKLIEKYGVDDVEALDYLIDKQTGILGLAPDEILRLAP